MSFPPVEYDFFNYKISTRTSDVFVKTLIYALTFVKKFWRQIDIFFK